MGSWGSGVGQTTDPESPRDLRRHRVRADRTPESPGTFPLEGEVWSRIPVTPPVGGGTPQTPGPARSPSTRLSGDGHSTGATGDTAGTGRGGDGDGGGMVTGPHALDGGQGSSDRDRRTVRGRGGGNGCTQDAGSERDGNGRTVTQETGMPSSYKGRERP